MTDDLVKHVRDNFIDPKTVPWSFKSPNILLHKLADRIEALTAEVDRLKDKVARQSEQITGLEASRRKLESLTAGAHRRVADVEAERDRLRSLLAEADCRIVWEGHGFGNDFAERVEAALKGQQP